MDLHIYVCDGCHQAEFYAERFAHEPRRHTCNAGKLEYQGMVSVFFSKEGEVSE